MSRGSAVLPSIQTDTDVEPALVLGIRAMRETRADAVSREDAWRHSAAVLSDAADYKRPLTEPVRSRPARCLTASDVRPIFSTQPIS